MPKLPLATIAATLYATAAFAVPDFAATASSAWYSYSREWMPPTSGPGPVMQDKAHPRVSNDDFRATSQQPTYPFADTRNPIRSLGRRKPGPIFLFVGIETATRPTLA